VDQLIAISAASIPVEGMAIDVTVPSRWLDAALADAKLSVGVGDWEARSIGQGGHLHARLSRSGQDIVVRGHVAAEIVLACVRCLGPTHIPVDGELSLLLRPLSRAALAHHAAAGRPARADGSERDSDPEHEFSAEEADVDGYDGETVVLDEFVREAILLELPQFPLCSDGCVGIPPALPGADLPVGQPLVPADVDPRLAPLGALRTKLTGESPPDESAHDLGERTISPKKPMLRSSTRRGLSKGKKKAKRKE
jgi:uncharacterized protein